MEINDDLKKKFVTNPKKSQFLHSPDHLLADELSQKLNEPKRFGFYLRMATKHDHGILRRIAGEVMENSNAKNPGALFAFLIKKEFTDDPANNKISK
jgi:hypothetical protein